MSDSCSFEASRKLSAKYAPFTLRKPYPSNQTPPIVNIYWEKLSKFEIIEPNPKIPSNIKIISDKVQKSAMGRTCCLSNPWRKTKAFCGPMAKISEKLSKKPDRKAVFKNHFLLEPISPDLSLGL